jgi:hypothetical protein
MAGHRRRFTDQQLIDLHDQGFNDLEIGEKLEFAHVLETALKGRGRGRKERYYDIIKNPDCYRLLCQFHYKEMDNEEDARKETNTQ